MTERERDLELGRRFNQSMQEAWEVPFNAPSFAMVLLAVTVVFAIILFLCGGFR